MPTLAAAGAVKVSDIRTTPAGTQVSDPVVMNNRLYFVADDGVSGAELRIGGAGTSGSIRLKDINPGPGSGLSLSTASLTPIGTTLYFVAQGDTGIPALWKTNGTEAGTVSLPAQTPANLTNVNGTLYFSANFEGQEPFRSDGTPGGTVRIKDIYGFYLIPEPISGRVYYSSNPYGFVAVGSTVFFAATVGSSGTELWKTDGTEVGTVLVKDIFAGIGSTNPRNLTSFNNALYFTATDATGDTELWRSDGTDAGTFRVKDINPAGGSNPQGFVVHNGTLYFSATDGTGGIELWKSDGSSGGTVRVKDINPGAGGSSPGKLASLLGSLYFVADDGTSGVELWKSDGTDVGTVRVKDIAPGAASASPKRLTVMGAFLYFVADDGTGAALWRSDGTGGGTTKVVSPFPALGFPEAGPFAVLSNIMHFAGADPAGGTELWFTDGTPGGTRMAKDLNPGAGSLGLGGLTNRGGTLFFSADGGSNGIELWKSDGTTAGTIMVKDINPLGSSNPRNFTVVNGKLYFVADGVSFGAELWTSNGTDAGTFRVKAVNSGPFASASSGVLGPLTEMNGLMYFSGHSYFNVLGGAELWRSDGTEFGTVQVKDINPGATGSNPRNLVNVNGTLFFVADDGTNGEELWKSDGTEGGTVLVKDINPGATGSNPRNLVNVNGTLFFVADDGTNGGELWKSDGTDAGTVLVKDIVAGPEASDPRELVAMDGVLYFAAYEASTSVELWKSDGTAAGTVLVKDINPVVLQTGGGIPAGSYPAYLTPVNGTLFFAAVDSTGSRELWKSDGTAAGTVLVKDIAPVSSSPENLVNAYGTLYFTANDGTNGIELWKSDGTAAGTVMVQDINPGGGDSLPRDLTVVGGTLLFTAFDGGRRGLWSTSLTPTTIPRLKNISTRMQVLTGNDVLIGGFIIGGTQPKTVVVRARGPSLVPFGVPNAIANPQLQLFSGQTQIGYNDDWATAPNSAGLTSSGFAPSDPREAAILTTLAPGAYTAIVSGVGGGTGVGIVEVFEVDLPDVPLVNISTRGQVLTGGDVMIGGFIIQGGAPQTVVVRARGPSLAAFGITNFLQDPVLQVYSGQTVIATSDDWQSSPNATSIQARGFAPSDARESAVLLTLTPGAYTAIVTGKGGTTGVGIIEVFAQ